MPEFDEFGIPIKTQTTETKSADVDEFGIPIKKKNLLHHRGKVFSNQVLENLYQVVQKILILALQLLLKSKLIRRKRS